MMEMREYMREKKIDGVIEEEIEERVGMRGEMIEEM